MPQLKDRPSIQSAQASPEVLERPQSVKNSEAMSLKAELALQRSKKNYTAAYAIEAEIDVLRGRKPLLRPAGPGSKSHLGAALLAVRATLEGESTPDVRTRMQLIWRMARPTATSTLASDLKLLEELVARGLAAKQQPLYAFGGEPWSTWVAIETPYWKPGQVAKLVKATRQGAPRKKARR